MVYIRIMETKHTTGPWRTTRVSGYHAVLYGNGTIAPTVYGNDDEQAAANAKLIAAAPDLLAALQAFASIDDFSGWHPKFRDAIEKAEAAIKAANA